MTTRDDISRWIVSRPKGTTHMLVVCDTWDYSDYPVYYPESADLNTDPPMTIQEVYASMHGSNMQKVMEIYSFTGKHTVEDQFAEFRAIHYD